MARGLQLTDDDLQTVYTRWNQGELNGYLMEITSHIFGRIDKQTGKRLIDVILDEAGQKGTGKWTSQSAMDLEVPVPTIDAAVATRNLSNLKKQREAASRALHGPERVAHGDGNRFIHQLRNALYVGMITAYGQGFALLAAASDAYGYDLHLAEVARIWRGGCIIRSALLEQIRAAFVARPDLPHLLLDRQLGWEAMARQVDLRAVVRSGGLPGYPGAGSDGDSGLLRRLPQRMVAGKSDSGAA